MADLTKVINGLEKCIEQGTSATYDCPHCPYYTTEARLTCWIDVLKDALTLLKKQSIKIADLKLERKELRSDPDRVKVVRCADCRYWEPENAEEGDSYGRCRNNYAPCQNQQTDMSWFCADGEREG